MLMSFLPLWMIFDQTSINYVPVSQWSIARELVEVAGVLRKMKIILPVQLAKSQNAFKNDFPTYYQHHNEDTYCS